MARPKPVGMMEAGDLACRSISFFWIVISLPSMVANTTDCPTSRRFRPVMIAAIFQHGNGVVKGYVDVAIGVDDVLHQSLDAAIADALELWPDVGTDPVELVAGGAVCGVDIFALLGVASFFPILGDAIGDQPFNLSAWLEEILRQHRHAFLREPVADVNVQQ